MILLTVDYLADISSAETIAAEVIHPDDIDVRFSGSSKVLATRSIVFSPNYSLLNKISEGWTISYAHYASR